jgi:DNA-binding LacI/PurR family transcriptional regulator
MEAEVPNVNQSQAGRLDNQQDPSRAIFTVSDTLAMGALKLCKASGLRVPGDVALASLDDISIVGLVDPALTTVPLLARKLGQEAMAMLISLI